MRQLTLPVGWIQDDPPGHGVRGHRKYELIVPARADGTSGGRGAFVLGPRSVADLGATFGVGTLVEVKWFDIDDEWPFTQIIAAVYYGGRQIWPIYHTADGVDARW